MASNFPSDSPVNILLIGLGSIGSIYAYLLEKVCTAECPDFLLLINVDS